MELLSIAIDIGQITSVSFMVAAIAKRARLVSDYKVPIVALVTGVTMGALMGFSHSGFAGVLGGMLIGITGLASTGFWEGAKSVGGESVDQEDLTHMGDGTI